MDRNELLEFARIRGNRGQMDKKRERKRERDRERERRRLSERFKNEKTKQQQ